MRRIIDKDYAMVYTVVDKPHIEVTAVAIDVLKAPISAISSLFFGVSFKHGSKPEKAETTLVQPLADEVKCAICSWRLKSSSQVSCISPETAW